MASSENGALHGRGLALIAEEAGCPENDGPVSLQTFVLSGPVAGGLLKAELRGGRLVIDEEFAAQFERFREAISATGETLGKLYCRLAPPLIDPWSPAGLSALGKALPPSASGSASPVCDRMPAAFGYLLQFIVHDLSNLRRLTDENEPLRTAALDLDSLFDVPASMMAGNLANPRQRWVGGVGLGRTAGLTSSWTDLPRTPDGDAVIADHRNDSNLALAQMQVAFTKFYHLLWSDLFEAHPGWSEHQITGEARRQTLRHVQSIVLHDLLGRLTDPDIHADIEANGRRIIFPKASPGQYRSPKGQFLMPIEATAAFLRIGHSMARPMYPDWINGRNNASLSQLVRFTGRRLKPNPGLPESWIANWPAMLGSADEAAGVVRADELDTEMAGHLSETYYWIHARDVRDEFEPGSVNLASVTLRRSHSYELPSAQSLWSHVSGLLPNDGPLIPGTELETSITNLINNLPDNERNIEGGPYHEHTPLWLYTLLEAQHPQGGRRRRLGPLASRFVTETLHAAAEAAQDGIVNDDHSLNFTSDESRSGNSRYMLRDLFKAIGTDLS